MKISNFESSDVDFIEVHGIDILTRLDGRQILNLANDLTLLCDAIDSFLNVIYNMRTQKWRGLYKK